MGGGEKHALDIANLFQNNNDVYLVSEVNFDIDLLGEYFGLDLSNVRKIISTRVDTYFSSKFDIFINSTFRSNLISAAKENLYVVSFPHDDFHREIIDCYTFLHNSPFTQEWANSLWGPHRSLTILPIIGFSDIPKDRFGFVKNKVITSVGRFTYDGHCKNHHSIVRAFRNIVDKRPDLNDWTLKIVGSCDLSQKSSGEYLSDLRNDAIGYRIEIHPNVSHVALSQIYAESAIYVHATGLGVPINRPEMHEHFGISCFEAMLYGSLPIVYAYGGPAMQVNGIDGARVFKDELSLMACLEAAIMDIDNFQFDPVRAVSQAKYLIDSNIVELAKLPMYSQYIMS